MGMATRFGNGTIYNTKSQIGPQQQQQRQSDRYRRRQRQRPGNYVFSLCERDGVGERERERKEGLVDNAPQVCLF
jgi:hypothetical protein